MTGREGDSGDPLRDLAVDEEGPFPIGEYLARQRRLRGVSLEDLAQITRIPRRSLERLEEGAFDGESDGFARGFVRSVANALGLDAEDTTMLMLAEPQVEPGRGRFDRFVPRVVAAATVLLLIGGAILLARSPEPQETSAEVPIDSAMPTRRDAVRELAEEQGLLTTAPESAGESVPRR